MNTFFSKRMRYVRVLSYLLVFSIGLMPYQARPMQAVPVVVAAEVPLLLEAATNIVAYAAASGGTYTVLQLIAMEKEEPLKYAEHMAATQFVEWIKSFAPSSADDIKTVPELVTPSLPEISLPDIQCAEIPKSVIPQVKPQPQAPARILDCLVTLDQKSLGILALSSTAIGVERAKRVKTLIDQRAKRRAQTRKIEEQCKRSAERINDRLFLEDLCAYDTQFAAAFNAECERITSFFESCLQKSTTLDVIAQQLELIYYPVGYDISEKLPGLVDCFKTTIQKLQKLLFNSSGRFTGITTPEQQKIAAEIYAEFLHKCSLTGSVFDAQKYLNKLQDCVKKGLPYFAEMYTQALNNKNLSIWRSGHAAYGWPNSFAQKIDSNTFNHDLKAFVELLSADPEDRHGTLPQCADLVAPYVSAAQGVSWWDFATDAEGQRTFLQKFLDDAFKRLYTPEGIRNEYMDDPLLPQILPAVQAQELPADLANELLKNRKLAFDKIIEMLGVVPTNITKPLCELVYGIVDHGNDPRTIPAYLKTQVGDGGLDPAKRAYKELFFDKNGLPRIFRCIDHMPTDVPQTSQSPTGPEVLPLPQNQNIPTQPPVPSDTQAPDAVPTAEKPPMADTLPQTVSEAPPVQAPPADASLVQTPPKDTPASSPAARGTMPPVPPHDVPAQTTLPPAENPVTPPIPVYYDVPHELSQREKLPDENKKPEAPQAPQPQPPVSRNPFAHTMAAFVDYIRKNPYKACELAIVSAAMYDDFLDHLRYGDDYADDVSDEDDVVELCENMFGDYLTKEQLDDLIKKLKGTMLFKGSGNGNGSGNGGNNGGNGGGGNGDDPHNRNCGNPKMPSKPPKLSPLLAAMYKFWKKNKQKYDNLPGTKIKAPKINGAQVPKNQRYSSKNAQHNYKHYFSPDIKPYAKKGSGFHLNSNGMFNKILEFRNKTDYKHGFYSADWRYGNLNYKFSSFWPDTWSYKKVLKKIVEAASNQVKAPTWKGSTIEVIGRIKEGYDVVIVYQADPLTRLATGKIITAYPILK